MPPSIKILEERLHSRSTDNKESIARRIAKAEKELKTAELFDVFILNEVLEEACIKAEEIVGDFLKIRWVSVNKKADKQISNFSQFICLP